MRKFTVLFLIMLFTSTCVYANENNVKEQFKSSGAYETFEVAEEYFEDFDSMDILEGFLEGEPFNEKKLIYKLTDIFLGHAKKITKSLAFLVLCGVIISFMANAGNSLREKNSDVGIMAGYIIFSSALITFFNELITPAQNAVSDISIMVKSLYAVLMTSVAVSGGVVTCGLMQNITLLSVSAITETISKLFLPLTIVSVVLSAAGNMSEKMNIDNLIKMIRSFIKWCVSFFMIFFVGLFSLYGITGMSIDAWAGKTAKFIIGSSVPVVGGVISDSLGTILSTIRAVRNITGNIGIIVVILIAVTPIIRTVVYIWSLKLCAGILEPITDRRIIKLINEVSQSAVLILICLISVTLLFVCGITVILISANMLG